MEAENSSETSVTLYRSAWHDIPDAFNLHHQRRADITSHITRFLNGPLMLQVTSLKEIPH